MSVRQEKLSRAGKAFEAKCKMLSVRLSALSHEMQEITSAIREIGSAMDSPLVHALFLHAPAARRIAGLKQKNTALDEELAALRVAAIEAKTRAKLATQLSVAFKSAEIRKDSEHESLETVTLMSVSSLRQAGGD